MSERTTSLNDEVVPSVLLHTLPCGISGARAEEAVYRQYNSCVDFTFKSDQQFVNSRRLKRLNLIFERAADQNFFGLREDKLLKILPPESAGKYGLDPSAIEMRAKNKEKSGVRVLSRGTFLAMFANESNNFINLMAQTEKAHRQKGKKNKTKTRHKHKSKKLNPNSSARPSNSTMARRNSNPDPNRGQEYNHHKSMSRSKRSSTKATNAQPDGKNSYSDVYDNDVMINSSLSQKRKTHRRRMSVHSIDSEDSPFPMDVPSQITRAIFDPPCTNHYKKQVPGTPVLVSDISDSDTSISYSDRYHHQPRCCDPQSTSHHYPSDGHHSSSTSHVVSEDESYYNQNAQQTYDGHPADEAGGHASIVSLSSEGSSGQSPQNPPSVPRNYSYQLNHDYNYNSTANASYHYHHDAVTQENKEKKARRRQQRYLKHQRRMEEFRQEQMITQNKIQFLQHQQFVSRSKRNNDPQECVFLLSVINALKHLFAPKQQHKIYITPLTYSQHGTTSAAVGPYHPHMNSVREFDIYNSLPPNHRFHGCYQRK